MSIKYCNRKIEILLKIDSKCIGTKPFQRSKCSKKLLFSKFSILPIVDRRVSDITIIPNPIFTKISIKNC